MSATLRTYLVVWCDHELIDTRRGNASHLGFTCNNSFEREGTATDGKFYAKQEGWSTVGGKWYCASHARCAGCEDARHPHGPLLRVPERTGTPSDSANGADRG